VSKDKWMLNWQVTEEGLYDVCDEGPNFAPGEWWSNIPVVKGKVHYGKRAELHLGFLNPRNSKRLLVNDAHGWLFRKVN
jgi:hypothetical protein